VPIAVNTDKDTYVEGDPIVFTVTTTDPEPTIHTYTLVAHRTVNGNPENAGKNITVAFGVPDTSEVTVEVSPGWGAPAFALVADPANPGTFVGTIPTD
jgi:hypothetical protein